MHGFKFFRRRIGNIMIFSACAILVLVSHNVYAQKNPAESIRSARTVFYRDGDRAAALSILERAGSEAAAIDDKPGKLVTLADIALARGEIYETSLDSAKAKELFGQALAYSREAEKISAHSSEVQRALAESGMRILPYTDMLYKIGNGFWPKGCAEKALALDSGNARATLALGQYYLYCPTFFGGNKAEACRLFSEYSKTSTGELDAFIGFMWQGISCREAKRPKDASNAFASAAAIYPNSPWLALERSKNGGTL